MKNKFSQAIVLSMVTLSSAALLTACSSHKESSSADKTPKSSQVTSSSKAKTSSKDSGKTSKSSAKVKESSGSKAESSSTQSSQKASAQVRVAVSLSHHLQRVHQLPQVASPKLLNLQTRVNLQPVNPKRQRAQVIVKLQVVNLAVKLKLKRICK